MAELVRKLKAVLRPVRVLGGETDRDTTFRRALEIRLRMVVPMIDVDTIELSPWTVLPKFKGRRPQEGSNISGTSAAKSVRLHPDIEWPRINRRG